MKSGVKEITKDQNGNINGIILNDGTLLNVDMAIIGTGIAPNTKFLDRHDSGIKIDQKGAVVCDPFLESSIKDIFAAGDVCSFPYWQTG